MERKEEMTSSFSLTETRLLLALATPLTREIFTHLNLSPEEALHSAPSALKKRGVPEKIALSWRQYLHRCQPKKILEECTREEITLLFPDEPGWPDRLRHLGKQAPSLLFVRGQIPDIPYLAIIGTRRPTSYGERATDELIHGLAGSRIGIVSGLAFGTDGRAHLRALDHSLPTLAVLGSSITDKELYPQKHRGLAKRIIANHGGLVSEYPPGSLIHQGAFPARNRLIAALSQAVIVIEAREKSGTLITARIALELGRDVLAVPGSIFSDASHGTHTLLAAGAHLCRDTNDIWEALAVDPPLQAHQARTQMQISAEDRTLFDLLDKNESGLALDDLSGPLHKGPNELAARLGLLELQGLVRQGPSGRWQRCGLA